MICEKQDYHKSSNVISLLRYSQLNCVLKGFCAGFPLGRKLSRIAMKLRFLSVPNEFQKLLLQAYLTQCDLLYHVSPAQFICLQYMVPVCMLWLHVLFTPVSYQQVSLDTASHCSLYLHLDLILQPKAQGAPKINISYPSILSSACNQAVCKYTSYTGAILGRTSSLTVSTTPA